MNYAAARQNMLESQIRTADVTDHALQDAIAKAGRETLLPSDQRHAAYADATPAYRAGRHLLSPRDVGKLLQALSPKFGEAALAISAPYAAMVMRLMGLSVVECDADDLVSAMPGQHDLMICEGAVCAVPRLWTLGLVIGGRLGLVERTGPVGQAVLYARSETGIGRRKLFDATPPFMAGYAPEVGFVF